MADHITGFKTKDGVKKYDYNSLANLPGVTNGKSAYEIAVDNGFVGTEEEWIASLGITISAIKETTGDSAYSIVTFSDGNTLRVKNGSKGSKGEKGEKGGYYSPFITSGSDGLVHISFERSENNMPVVEEYVFTLPVIPAGGIIMWSGAAADIPLGWALCDGENGTPDLRNRFIVGAGGEYSVGEIGGEKEHTLAVEELPEITGRYSLTLNKSDMYSPHGVFEESDIAEGYYQYQSAHEGSSMNSISKLKFNNGGKNMAHENRPPYYALCFIMRIGSAVSVDG